MTGSSTRFSIKLLCLDPSPMLNKNMNAAKAAILFSATLSPLRYFKSILGGRDDDITLKLPSPFPRENLLVFNEDRIETRFRHRAHYTDATAEAIYKWASSHKGNVMVFFPSYKYMLDVLEKFKEMGEDFDILCQDREMDEQARDAFLKKFDDFGDVNRIAFCVMGGIFGEGIDLTGERLTGVIIVGVGLPQVSPELEIMRDYYQEKCGAGFTYAYTYPGLNKVLQASGRLIRSETDRGALLLIDSRFATSEYIGLLPQEWQPLPRSSQGMSLKEWAQRFWKNIM
jgi:DNA excision repair protein ERCC-2